MSERWLCKHPTDLDWRPHHVVQSVLECMDHLLKQRQLTGPYMLRYSAEWELYMSDDYILIGGQMTNRPLRNRLLNIMGIEAVYRRSNEITGEFAIDMMSEDDKTVLMTMVVK